MLRFFHFFKLIKKKTAQRFSTFLPHIAFNIISTLNLRKENVTHKWVNKEDLGI